MGKSLTLKGNHGYSTFFICYFIYMVRYLYGSIIINDQQLFQEYTIYVFKAWNFFNWYWFFYLAVQYDFQVYECRFHLGGYHPVFTVREGG